MMLFKNNIEISLGCWNSEIRLHENNNVYFYNHFMEYWEKDNKFYRWLNDKDKKDIEEHKKYYFDSLDW